MAQAPRLAKVTAALLLVFVLCASMALAAPPETPRCRRAASKLTALEQKVAEEPTPSRLRRLERLERKTDDRCVRLNQVQVLATHNSYHVEGAAALLALLIAFDPSFIALEYGQIPLDQQFETQGIRAIELDVFADPPPGGLYALRRGNILIGQDPDPHLPSLTQPGFKVLHVQDVDFQTTCLTLVECLQTVKAWSDTHPGHLPIMIQIEAKDDVIPDPVSLGFTIPIPIGTPQLNDLDAEIRSVFPEKRLITPDQIRGKFATLEEAVLTHGWPTLQQSRGKVLFTLDNEGGKRAAYRVGRPNLEGRVLFTPSQPGEMDAAFIKENDPLADPTRIPSLVSSGYIVRTRADADTIQARTGDTTQREAALASGAQYVSTDYPVPDPDFGTGYFVEIPDGSPARCNPVNGPAGCRSEALEPLTATP